MISKRVAHRNCIGRSHGRPLHQGFSDCGSSLSFAAFESACAKASYVPHDYQPKGCTQAGRPHAQHCRHHQHQVILIVDHNDHNSTLDQGSYLLHLHSHTEYASAKHPSKKLLLCSPMYRASGLTTLQQVKPAFRQLQAGECVTTLNVPVSRFWIFTDIWMSFRA